MVQANEVRVNNRYIRELSYLSHGLEYDKDFILTEENMGLLFTDIKLSLQDLFPIPLTDKVLVNCGLDYWDNDWWRIKNNWLELSVNNVSGEVCIQSNKDKGSQLFSKESLKCTSLHQLQNLYFALTGTELTYKPTSKV